MSNLSYFIELLQLFPDCFIYTPFVTLSIFVALSNFCSLIKILLFSIHFLRFLYKHNAYSRLIGRTSSALIQFSNPAAVFDQRAILMWGDRGMAGGLLIEQPDML